MNEQGQGFVEYILILLILFVVVVVVLLAIGDTLTSVFESLMGILLKIRYIEA